MISDSCFCRSNFSFQNLYLNFFAQILLLNFFPLKFPVFDQDQACFLLLKWFSSKSFLSLILIPKRHVMDKQTQSLSQCSTSLITNKKVDKTRWLITKYMPPCLRGNPIATTSKTALYPTLPLTPLTLVSTFIWSSKGLYKSVFRIEVPEPYPLSNSGQNLGR